MKKTIAMLLAGMMLAGALTACGGSSGSSASNAEPAKEETTEAAADTNAAGTTEAAVAADAAATGAAAEDAGVKLQVGFVRRFDHNHKAVRDVVASGELGKTYVVKVTSRDPEGPPMSYVEVSGGIFNDMMIHDFDMVRYLSGSEVTEVNAVGAVLTDPEYAKYDDVDTAIVTLRFANGAIGVIDNCRTAPYGYDQRVEVHCEKGCVRDGNDLEHEAVVSRGDGVFSAKPTWFFLERYNDAFIEEEKVFVDAGLDNKPVPVDGNDGLQPVRIALAAKKSLKEGRTVRMDEIEG